MKLTIGDHLLAFFIASSIFANMAGVTYLWHLDHWFFSIFAVVGFVSHLILGFIVIISTE